MSHPVLGPAIMTMADQLARHSDDPQGLTCAYLTPAHRACAQQLLAWMNHAGLQAHIDAVGNVVGRLACGKADAKTLMTGSHYDTVRNAGKYDGRLGVLLPIAVARHLCDTGVALDFDLEIIGFADEEGVRFGSTFLGSNPLAGRFDVSVLDHTDADGLRMRDLLAQTGGNAEAIAGLCQ
jgi:beta-ureidopropionase / N-carbamoyl-L-amino-acid hydrolase